MRIKLKCFGVCFATASALVGLLASFTSFGGSFPLPPESKREEFVESIHGEIITDPYRWLEESKSQETREWIDKQNEYFRSFLSKIPGRESIKARISELRRVDSVGIPTERGGRYFFSKLLAEDELSKIYYREGLDGEDKLLLEPFSFAEDGSINVGLEAISKDGELIAYSLRIGGADEVEVRLMNVSTGEDLKDVFPNMHFSEIYFTPDKKAMYYTNHLKEGPRVFYHVLGNDPKDDELIFGGEYGSEQFISIYLTDDGNYLLASVGYGWSKNDLFLCELRKDKGFKPVVTERDATFEGYIGGENLYILTNYMASRRRVCVAPLASPEIENWREIIPEGEDTLESISLVGGRIYGVYMHNATKILREFSSEGEFLRDVPLPALGSVAGMHGRWDSKEGFFSFSSFHTPPTIYRYEVASGEFHVWFKQEVPFDADKFEEKQVWFNSKDGTRVPMFVVHKKGINLDGNNPTLLTGYGGFNGSITPYFLGANALWLERAGVFATPNLRGGGEFGEEWHRAGMLDKKQNVFDDFISAAEWLIEEGYTNPQKLAIVGGSNGGLLVGAALTQRPELFRAVVCTYPLLDMLRYHKFLVGALWVPEYGNPEELEDFKYLRAYSPYHNVKEGVEYPAVLFVTGDFDTRVDPMHARKMTALLQWASASNPKEKPIILSYDTKAGHSGGLMMSEWVERETDEFLFLFWQLGLAE